MIKKHFTHKMLGKKALLKPYIDMNPELRKKAKN